MNGPADRERTFSAGLRSPQCRHACRWAWASSRWFLSSESSGPFGRRGSPGRIPLAGTQRGDGLAGRLRTSGPRPAGRAGGIAGGPPGDIAVGVIAGPDAAGCEAVGRRDGRGRVATRSTVAGDTTRHAMAAAAGPAVPGTPLPGIPSRDRHCRERHPGAAARSAVAGTPPGMPPATPPGPRHRRAAGGCGPRAQLGVRVGVSAGGPLGVEARAAVLAGPRVVTGGLRFRSRSLRPRDPLGIAARRGGDQALLFDPGRPDGLLERLSQAGVGLRELELPVVADQLIAELRGPGFHGPAGRIVRGDAAGPHQQQEDRARRRGGIEAAVGQEVLAGGPQRGGQRIARSLRPVEVVLREDDVLRLKHNVVGAAFQVDGAPPGLVRTLVGDHGVGVGAVLGLLLRLGQIAAGPRQIAFRLREFFLLHTAAPERFRLGKLWPAGSASVSWDKCCRSRRVWSSTWPRIKPGVGQLRLGLLAGLSGLSVCQLDRFPFGLHVVVLLGPSRPGRHGSPAAGPGRRDGQQQEHQPPIVQISTARKGKSGNPRGFPRNALSVPRRAHLHDGGAGALAVGRHAARPGCRQSMPPARKRPEGADVKSEREAASGGSSRSRSLAEETESQLADARLDPRPRRGPRPRLPQRLDGGGRPAERSMRTETLRRRSVQQDEDRPGRDASGGGPAACGRSRNRPPNPPPLLRHHPVRGSEPDPPAPDYLECRADDIVLQPENIVFTRGRFLRAAGAGQSTGRRVAGRPRVPPGPRRLRRPEGRRALSASFPGAAQRRRRLLCRPRGDEILGLGLRL